MRIDVVSIFPEYLAPLRLSLAGKAQDAGLIDVRVHDLRDWTHDRHRTVDDKPYGGGAGMVMRPEPWGEALDALVTERDPTGTPCWWCPTPSGEPFTQAVAAELASAEHLVFACGRYEGIDQRVLDEAATRMTVREVSLGDYVLNGGEVAALVVTEAVARLLPGFMGNPESLTEESHGESGLLEYPVYTKPAAWRGHDVPVGAALRRPRRGSPRGATTSRYDGRPPDARTCCTPAARSTSRARRSPSAPRPRATPASCSPCSSRAGSPRPWPTTRSTSSRCARTSATCWPGWRRRPRSSYTRGSGWSARCAGRLDGETWHIGRLMVAPDLRGRGLGRWLLAHVEAAAPPDADRLSVVTGAQSAANLRMCKKAGYRPVRDAVPRPRASCGSASRMRT